MPVEDFIITVYCCIADSYRSHALETVKVLNNIMRLKAILYKITKN
jgi:hypothetical protein